MDNGYKPVQADRNDSYEDEEVVALAPDPRIKGRVPVQRFTELAKKALSLAQEEAEKSHHSYIGTEHLLLALLREDEGLASKVLHNLGVEVGKVRQAIESLLGRNERIIVQQIIPTSRVKKVIEISFGSPGCHRGRRTCRCSTRS